MLKVRMYRQNREQNIFNDIQIVFVHIPKTGGTSISAELRLAQQRRRRELSRVEIMRGTKLFRPRVHKHAMGFIWANALGSQIWQSYTTFAIVRNPWDLVASSYFWHLNKGQQFGRHEVAAASIAAFRSFDEFLESPLQQSTVCGHPGQLVDWFKDTTTGLDVVDHVFRFEDVFRDFSTFLASIGLSGSGESGTPERRNVSPNRPHYQRLYSEKSRKLIEKQYGEVIERFKYSFA